MRRASRLLLVSLLVVAACGDDGGGGADAQPYVDAIVESMQAEDDALPLDAADQACAATAVVDAIGVDRLEEAGVSPDDLGDAEDLEDAGLEVEEGDREELAEGIADCDLDWSEFFAESLIGDSDLTFSDGSTACLREQILGGTEDELADGMAGALIGDAPDQAEVAQLFLAPLDACPRVLAELVSAGFAESGAAASEELVDCFEDEIAARVPGVAQTFLDASTDPALAQQFGEELAAACL